MGLDMRPMGKPKPGFEERFNQIFRIVSGIEKQRASFIDRLKVKRRPTKEELLEEWFANSIKSYETIKAPIVGKDKEADDWIKKKYSETDNH